jgi:hypothetical protein
MILKAIETLTSDTMGLVYRLGEVRTEIEMLIRKNKERSTQHGQEKNREKSTGEKAREKSGQEKQVI